MPSYVIGVDLGTSVVKATLVQTDFEVCAADATVGGLSLGAAGGMAVVASACRDMSMARPAPGVAEQDPDAYVASALETLREVVEQAGVQGGDVAAIAFSGQMGGAMAVDRRGDALTPWYPSTLDARYQPHLQRVMGEAGRQVIDLNGAVPILAPRIAWWRAEHPAIYRRIDKVLLLANYVVARLGDLAGDAICCDPSYLTWTGLADTQQRVWSPQLAALWDVPLAMLPRLVASASVVGGL
jgi:xylulokinase